MKLIILAAGKGTRLYPATKNVPKPAVRLNDGNSIIEHTISNLDQQIDFDEIVVISGYERHKLRQHLKKDVCNPKIKIINNPFYDSAGPLVSLWSVTHEMINDDFIILNGDTLYSGIPIDDLSLSGIYLAYSKVTTAESDAMKIKTKTDSLALNKVGKEISVELSDGISAGLIIVRGQPSRKKFVDTLTESITDNIDAFWHTILNQLVSEEVTVNLYEVPSSKWMEVDTLSDLDNLNQNLHLI